MKITKIDSCCPTSRLDSIEPPFLRSSSLFTSSLSSAAQSKSILAYLSYLGRNICTVLQKAFKFLQVLLFLPVRAIKKCFDLLFPSKLPPEDTHLEVIPKDLGTDPFFHHLFEKNAEGVIALQDTTQKQAELTAHLFSTLAACSSLKDWIINAYSALNARDAVIKKGKIHPLAFLYFIFMNHQTAQNYFQFKQNAKLISVETAEKHFRHGHPLHDIMRNQISTFEQCDKKDILNMLPGFCTLLKLDLPSLRKLAQKEKWEKLITSVYAQCEKNYQTSIQNKK